ncbi:MAG: hypothetical protein ACP5QW_03665, partial [bacterium]
MNQELANVIKIYSTGSHQELGSYLLGKSKDTLIAILVDLLTMYINPKNAIGKFAHSFNPTIHLRYKD